MTTKISKTKKKEFDVDAFLESSAGKKYLERAMKSKIISHSDFLKRTAKLRKKFGLI